MKDVNYEAMPVLDNVFTDHLADPITEAMGAQLYINLAQGAQVVSTYIGENDVLEDDVAKKIVDTFIQALHWMDRMGLADRHPDLKQMPMAVEPIDFQGGGEANIQQWLEAQLEQIMADRMDLIQHHLN